MSTKATSVFKDPEVAGTLTTIHDKYETHNSIALICKKHYPKHRPYLQKALPHVY
jgi:hypothetical protein